MYLIFYFWGHNQGGSQVLLPATLNHLNFIVKVASQLRTQSKWKRKYSQICKLRHPTNFKVHVKYQRKGEAANAEKAGK